MSRNSDAAILFDTSDGAKSVGQHQQYELTRYSPDGSKVVRATLQFEGLGARRVPLTGNTSSIVAAAFSADSRWLVASTIDRPAEIWDVASGAVRHVLRGDSRKASHVAFSADGRWLVTASDDRTARIWEAATGAELMTLQGHTGPVRSAVFSSDGEYVVTASVDGTARRWPMDPLKIALLRKPRDLTPEERARFEIDE